MEQNARQQIIDRLKSANNVLVTVSNNPSVDQLAACIGITLLMNHLGKHGTAVFSGAVPSTIEFLKPEETIEKNTDSLRDFIIALDKSKADKLRYKVEDTVVKIFITPYRTSLSEKDLDFSQGDFNVDVVLALGVKERTDIDQAIMAHGRILHDATVISVNNKEQGDIGAINLIDLHSSSLSEMLVELAKGLTSDPLDAQMATAFMTGIVAETDRFSNTKTSPRTMAIASELMANGANQQLIASKLESTVAVQEAETNGKQTSEAEASESGTLTIEHQQEKAAETTSVAKPVPAESKIEEKGGELADSLKAKPVDDKKDEIDTILNSLATPAPNNINLAPPQITPLSPELADKPSAPSATVPAAPTLSSRPSGMALEPPTLGGQLTANSEPEHLRPEPSTDPLSLGSVDNSGRGGVVPPILDHPNSTPSPLGDQVAAQKLTDIEKSVQSPHLPGEDTTTAQKVDAEEQVEEAREAVDAAIGAEPSKQPLEPIKALGAQPLSQDLHSAPAEPPKPVETATDEGNLQSQTDAEKPGSAAPIPTPLGLPPTPPISQAPSQNPFTNAPSVNGVNPNEVSSVPSSLLPKEPPVDSTAGSGSPSPPPPVPPPLMPPADSSTPNQPL